MSSYKRLSSIAAFLFLLLFSASAFAATTVDEGKANAGEPPTITGTCDLGTTVDVVITDAKGAEVTSGSVPCSESGTWSFTSKSGLDIGVYDVNATTKAGSGSGTLTISAPPSAPIVDAVETTSDTPPTLTGSCEAGSTVDVAIKDAKGTVITSGSVACSKEGTWSFTPKSGVAAGTYNIEACNSGACDETSDELTVTDPVPPPTIEAVSSETATPTLTGTCVAGSTVTLNIRQAAIKGKEKVTEITGVEVACSKEGTWSYTPTEELENGTYDVTACSPDETNCDATDGELVVAVPAAPTVDTQTSESATPTLTGTCVAGSTVTLNIRQAVIKGKEKVTEITGVEVACSKEGTWSYTPTDELENGTYDVTACSPDETNCDATDGELEVAVVDDADKDGIPDSVEKGEGETPLDSDKDGIPDFEDTDSDNDGVSDADEAGDNPETPTDTDKDGVPDYKDLDSDNDGITDVTESGGKDDDSDGLLDDGEELTTEPTDTDKDGTPDHKEVDSDKDGVNDIEGTDKADLDADKDGKIDDDTDTDGDGIPDVVDGKEGEPGTDGDADKDGIPDSVEKGDGKEPLDTDGDGTPDYLDTDSDNDGIPDSEEAGDDPANPVDTDKDGVPDFKDLDSDNDGITDVKESGGKDDDNDGLLDDGEAPTEAPVDTDEDGVPDFKDPDSDNDGVNDIEGTDNAALDADKDGKIDDDTDTDGDGIPDATDIADGFGTDADSDKDGIPDSVEKGDGKEPLDTDGDGTPDYLDTDSDNDGISDSKEAGDDPANPVNTDGDGVPDYQDLDSDNDGKTDVEESGGKDTDNDGLLDDGEAPTEAPVDTDEDGVPDFKDPDSDNDGVNDIESGPAAGLDEDMDGKIDDDTDTDGDGIPDSQDTKEGPGKESDTDLDGIPDSVEIGSDPANPVDSDQDGTPDYLDTDSDNDGIPDTEEAGTDPANPVDSDEDGVPDYLDLDSDNDGLTDVDESGGADLDRDGKLDDGAPLTGSPTDTDEDGIPDYQDVDSDNDGVNDINGTEDSALDSDGDGRIDDITDLDGDGIPDVIDGSPGSPGTSAADFDNDGIVDAIDLDDDNDGIPDAQEGDGAIDTDDDGMPDSMDSDSDNDGLTDAFEADPSNNFDADGDGIVDNFADENGDGLNDNTSPDMVPANSDSDSQPNFQDLNSDNDLYTDAIEDGDYDNNGIHDSIESGCDDCLEAGDGGGGGGSSGWLFLMALIALLAMRAKQFRKAGYSLVAFFTLSAAATNVAATDCGGSNEDFSGCLYGTVGAAYSQLEPEGVSSGWFTDGDNDTGFNLGVGWQFAPNWFAELNYADLGEATLSNYNPNIPGSESVGYSTISAIIGYQFGSVGNNWRPYVRAGAVDMDIDLSDPELCNADTDVQLTGGLGIEYQPDDSNFFARGGADWYSSDAAVVGLTIGTYFGGKAIAARSIPAPVTAPAAPVTPAPTPAVEMVPDVAATPEPVISCPVGEILDDRTINFETDKAIIRNPSFPTLDNLADLSSQCLDMRFVIGGHTDSRGSDSYNQDLSQRRAQAVVDYLIQQGVDRDQFRAIGYGEMRPIGDNQTPEGRLMNRRIEVEIDENVN